MPKRVTLVVKPVTEKSGSKTFNKCKPQTRFSWVGSTHRNEDDSPNSGRPTLLQSRNESVDSLYGKKRSEIKIGIDAPESVEVTSNGEEADDNSENFDWLDSQI